MRQLAWRPSLAGGATPLYEQLVEALAREVRSGTLPAGFRLPTQRELAEHLGMALGTVTRALHEARRRGLVTAQVGRGSFVAAMAQGARAEEMAEAPIDLARNIPPLAPMAAPLADSLAALAYQMAPGLLGDYAPAAGLPHHRELMAGWLRRTTALSELDGSRVLLCNGATQGMALAFAALCRPGDTILCDAATYSGMKVLADHAGYRLLGVAMDEEGITPRALDKAIRASAARVWYALPTLQNPTARTMSAARRRALVELARKRDLWIVEDDVYAPLGHEAGVVQLAALAPERTFHVGSLKLLFPGFRAGYLIPPTVGALVDKVNTGLLAQSRAAENLTRSLVARWLEDGTCDTICARVQAETRWRTARACELLHEHVERPSIGASLHLWLPMPALDAERVTAAALRAHLELTPPAAPIVDPTSTSGIRLCLGAVSERAVLERSLVTLRNLLASRSDANPAAHLV